MKMRENCKNEHWKRGEFAVRSALILDESSEKANTGRESKHLRNGDRESSKTTRYYRYILFIRSIAGEYKIIAVAGKRTG